MKRQDVVEFSEEKLEGVNVDGVDIGAGGSFLTMMVFVHEGVDAFHVEEPVEEGVEEVVGQKEKGQGEEGVGLEDRAERYEKRGRVRDRSRTTENTILLGRTDDNSSQPQMPFPPWQQGRSSKECRLVFLALHKYPK